MTSDSSDGHLDRWLADARADDARLARRREQWLLAQQEEAASFMGALVDLADVATDVVAETTTRRHSGRLRGVGLDMALLRDDTRWIIVPLSSLLAVRTVSRHRPTTGDRSNALNATFGEVLLELVAERDRVIVTLTSGERLTGRLTAVGTDVATLLLDGDSSSTAIVQLAAISDVIIS
ncbi:MAG: hypothetical protein P8N02_15155 [Actinomycetota bacterium]|jgi:hypothetical protein|nr:hypothetical protein [Actinomycetota bacterium]